jgi:hypothetical protein
MAENDGVALAVSVGVLDGVAGGVCEGVWVCVAAGVSVMVAVGSGSTQFEPSHDDPEKKILPPVQLACGTWLQPASGASQQSP